jgi:hypothetical protein
MRSSLLIEREFLNSIFLISPQKYFENAANSSHDENGCLLTDVAVAKNNIIWCAHLTRKLGA